MKSLSSFIATVACLLLWWAFPVFPSLGQSRDEFSKSVSPILTGTCVQCHNDRVATSGFSVMGLIGDGSVVQHREQWEKILKRVEAGQMPPANVVAKPSDAALRAFTSAIRAELDRADAAVKPDPGRVTAHRLNRNEYSNTIRDLLGVEFHAEKYFPTDDSGDGFDNIGEILSVSPVLMEKYLSASERIARWAISTELPPKSIVDEYHQRDRKIRRVDSSTIEAIHRVEYAGDYTVRFGLPGERAADAKPVTLNFWMDGKLLASKQIETRPSGLVYFNPYSEEEVKIYLPEGDHVFRAGFTDDEFVKTVAAADLYNDKKNKFLNSIVFIGPFQSAIVKESRKKILTCDPATGHACVESIISTLAHRAYRRPVTAKETASLVHFYDLAKADGHSTEQGLQLAIQAMLVSPNFIFRIERDAKPTDPKQVHQISEVELASRLSYFLWSSMPDDELLRLAESGKLRSSLPAQV